MWKELISLKHFSKVFSEGNKAPTQGGRAEVAAKERQEVNPNEDFAEIFKQVDLFKHWRRETSVFN